MATPVRRQQVDVAGGTEVSLDVTIGSLPARLIRVQASLPPAGGAGAPHQYGTNDPLVQAGAPGPPGTPGTSGTVAENILDTAEHEFLLPAEFAIHPRSPFLTHTVQLRTGAGTALTTWTVVSVL